MSERRRGRDLTMATFVYNGCEYEVDVDAELHIDRDVLSESFRDQPGKMAWYGAVFAAATTRVDECKLALAVTTARVAARLRSTPNDKGKTPSEAAITSQLPAEQEVIEAEQRLIEARRQEGVLRAVKEAFQHRRDMLIQIGYDARIEMRT